MKIKVDAHVTVPVLADVEVDAHGGVQIAESSLADTFYPLSVFPRDTRLQIIRQIELEARRAAKDQADVEF